MGNCFGGKVWLLGNGLLGAGLTWLLVTCKKARSTRLEVEKLEAGSSKLEER